MAPVSAEIAFTCQSSPDALWPVMTDTERLNRKVGMAKVTAEPLAGDSAARYLVHTRLGGFPVTYEERPFEWVYPERYRIVRRMLKGPLETLEMSFTLTPTPSGGTQVAIRLLLAPRYRVLSPFLGLMADRTLHGFQTAILALDAELAKGHRPQVDAGRIAAEPLRRAAVALQATEPEALVTHLTELVEQGDDLEVSRIRPFALADAWGEDRRAVLRACLAGVRAGLLDLHWEVVCPSCRTATEALPSLASLADHGTCQLCDLRFTIDLDDAVEATFAPSRAIRPIDLGPYCMGGPARTPHVLTQVIVPAEGEARLDVPREPGRYRLFVRGGQACPVEVAPGAPAERHLRAAELDGSKLAPLQIAPGGALLLQGQGPGESHAKLERATWEDQAARARAVMTMPGFRREFSEDILRPGMALKVARVGIFFSDLTGSTQLYTDAGDAAAFKLVHDHFDVVIGLIEKSGGALVKTIGDAVMAAFDDDLDGLRASVAILHAFERFRAEGEHRQRTHIKLGVYGGPCYAVTANGVLDYFGQTVNLAARLQAEAKSGELVVPAELCDRGLAAKAIPIAFVKERYEARPKGIEFPLAVARIKVG
ncbi:MAG: DUF5939 domain-containing protein [Byssovorax sp.]